MLKGTFYFAWRTYARGLDCRHGRASGWWMHHLNPFGSLHECTIKPCPNDCGRVGCFQHLPVVLQSAYGDLDLRPQSVDESVLNCWNHTDMCFILLHYITTHVYILQSCFRTIWHLYAFVNASSRWHHAMSHSHHSWIILESFLIHCHPSVEHVAAATYSSPTPAIPSVSSARFEALLVASSKGAEAQQLMVDGALQHVWLGRLELQWIY